MKKKKKILIAPLDWGLGHATRCIPIIQTYINLGCTVILLSNGRSLVLLRKEFPNLQFYELPDYNIYYQKSGSFVFKIFTQLGKIFKGIKKEHTVLQTIIQIENPDLIISDNRYGIWDKKIKSILITHQMMVKIPTASYLEGIVRWWIIRNHNKFHEVWIPDTGKEINISGDLSHKYPLPKNTKFIGTLTRFNNPTENVKKKYDVLVILSGPEPQRTIFETIIYNQAQEIEKSFLIIQGISDVKNNLKENSNIKSISFCQAHELFQFILESEVIISRGGYSTLMDLAHLNKKCIFVPTPGQTEQEYLVNALYKKNMVYSIGQNHFNLNLALREVEKTNGFYIETDLAEFTHTLENQLASFILKRNSGI